MKMGDCKLSGPGCATGMCQIEVVGDPITIQIGAGAGTDGDVTLAVTPGARIPSRERAIEVVNCIMNSMRERGTVTIANSPSRLAIAVSRMPGEPVKLGLRYGYYSEISEGSPTTLWCIEAELKRHGKRWDASEMRQMGDGALIHILWAFRDALDAHQRDPEWAAKRGPKSPN